MIGHLRYLGLLLPLFTFFILGSGQIPLSISPRRKPDRGVWASGELYRSRSGRSLFKADNDIRVSAAYVTFEPGARSAWHTHPAGQRLIVTSGVGLTQQAGQPVQVIRTGDVVSCPAGVKHWHGAAPAVQ
jgi:quercetin dioxygenase-like cupin family protein